MGRLKENEFDVIIIGGGATGAGTARDCALRGLRVLLVERNDIATGATGRNHGLLHSGARYAVTDTESAAECIRENMILKRIAKGCVERTEGLFITLPEDDLGYQAKFVEACRKAGIKARVIDPKEAIAMEPSVNPALIGAVVVPDGAVDPFRLTAANMTDAKIHGAKVLTYSEVLEIVKDGNTVKGVKIRNKRTGEVDTFYAPVTVNAGGIWGQGIARMAGVTVTMFPAKGSLLIFGHRVNNVVINRCRKPANADILVPGETISLIGTTSDRVSLEEVDSIRVTPEEVKILLEEGQKLSPVLAQTRIIRAYCGVRPLVAADNDPSGRNISRGIVLLDHEVRDGISGLITITGGKLMTYRLMAEWATDLVCKKLGVRKGCVTAARPLPGSGPSEKPASPRSDKDESLICECEKVSLRKAENAIDTMQVTNMIDLRRRTRLGMGTCQGELCACRGAGLLARKKENPARAKEDLKAFMNERWKGIYPICWGDSLRENEYTQWIYTHEI